MGELWGYDPLLVLLLQCSHRAESFPCFCSWPCNHLCFYCVYGQNDTHLRCVPGQRNREWQQLDPAKASLTATSATQRSGGCSGGLMIVCRECISGGCGWVQLHYILVSCVVIGQPVLSPAHLQRTAYMYQHLSCRQHSTTTSTHGLHPHTATRTCISSQTAAPHPQTRQQLPRPPPWGVEEGMAGEWVEG